MKLREKAETMKKGGHTVMHTICLKDNWTLTVLGKNVYDIPETPIETKVPSTVYGTLLEKGLIPDPFYRDNELDALKLMENDFAYETTIVISEEDRKADRLFLHFDGIDTIADVYLNGEKIGSADNMNRVWEYDITDLVAGDAADTVYQVKVVLHSPTKFIAEEEAKCPVGAASDAMPGFPHIRKAACMYGWDWGPRLPDAGLFREASVLAVKTARLAQVFVGQEHHVTGKTVHGNVVDFVRLTADAEIEWMPGVTDGKVKIVMTVTSPDGKTVLTAESGIDRERAVLFCVLFQCFFSKLHFFPEKGKCIFILRVGVEVKVHFNNSKADLINPGEQLFTGWHLRHHRHSPPPFPQNGLQSSGNKVPFFNAAERS